MIRRSAAYYVFWLPVVALVLVLEVLWRVTLLSALAGLRAAALRSDGE